METGLNALDIQDIMDVLPHRYPFLLLDRVTDYVPNEWLKGYKNISINEDCFNGHFPDKPIFPGVLILEAMAQASGVLGFKSLGNNDQFYLFAGIDNARFKQPVMPGDRLDIEVKVAKVKRNIWKFQGIASVAGKQACVADFTCALKDL